MKLVVHLDVAGKTSEEVAELLEKVQDTLPKGSTMVLHSGNVAVPVRKEMLRPKPVRKA